MVKDRQTYFLEPVEQTNINPWINQDITFENQVDCMCHVTGFRIIQILHTADCKVSTAQYMCFFRCASISCFQVVSKWVTKWLILFQIFSIYSLNSLYSLKSLQFVHSLHSLHSLKSIYIQYSWYLNTIKKVNTVNSIDSILALDQKRFSRWTDIFFYSFSLNISQN